VCLKDIFVSFCGFCVCFLSAPRVCFAFLFGPSALTTEVLFHKAAYISVYYRLPVVRECLCVAQVGVNLCSNQSGRLFVSFCLSFGTLAVPFGYFASISSSIILRRGYKNLNRSCCGRLRGRRSYVLHIPATAALRLLNLRWRWLVVLWRLRLLREVGALLLLLLLLLR